MSVILWIIGIGFIFFVLMILYAMCKVSGDADDYAGYMEEYSQNLDEQIYEKEE